MKIKYVLSALAATTGLILVAGCGKPQQTASPAVEPASKQPAAAPQQPASAATKTESSTPETPASPVTSAAQTARELSKPAVTQAVTQAAQALSEQAQAAPGTATNQFQTLVERAKTLTDNRNYQEALQVVQQLSNLQLTPEQQQLVENLKTQIQAALAKATATNATSVLGNILGGKK